MPLCTCNEGPRCQMYNGNRCGRERANWSVLVPATWKLPLRLQAKFACGDCWEYFTTMWDKPIKGLTRPENAPDDWRPSLMEMIRHGEIAVEFERLREQNRQPPKTDLRRPDDEKRYTSAQLVQVMNLRRLTRQYQQR
jgi:hypothetical protein